MLRALPDISWMSFHCLFHTNASGVEQAIDKSLGTVLAALALGK